MVHVRQEDLPFVGSSYEFVGAEQGNTGVSVPADMEVTPSRRSGDFECYGVFQQLSA